MNYKIEGAIRRNKKNFIIFLILWLFIAIVLIAPITYSFNLSNEGEETIIQIFIESMQNPFKTIGEIFSKELIGDYGKNLGIFTVVFGIFFMIGFTKSAPKNEYSDIEHGSSDWSKNGEQYKILSNKKGIILAEKNYLPVDKRGNVNVLVVGRFRFW